MNEETLKKLAEILSDNVGQRLTVALANGILNTLSHALALAPTPAAPEFVPQDQS